MKLPKIGMINPGFREASQDLTDQAKGKLSSRGRNPQDRKNLSYLFIAFFIFLLICCLLEYKQLREASAERRAAEAAAQTK